MAKAKKKDKKKKKSDDDNGEIIFQMQTKPKALVVVKIDEYKGKNYLKVMEMWRTDEDAEEDNDDWKYSKKIISLPLDSKEGKTSLAEKFTKKFIKTLKKREW